MPRLLLVDDNLSIHKIAETLLGPSSIELVCAGSAAEALTMLDDGERFDVALVDTAMPGMDGWELLSRMRKHPDTAYIPIAMMAGMMDTVDPDQLRHAPIQGFLKKPIELRDLAERVQQLLATPVTLAGNEDPEEAPSVLSPFSTVPGTKISSLPELREAVAGHFPSELAEDDLLVLTQEDLWPEEAPAPKPEPVPEAMPEVPSPMAHVDAPAELAPVVPVMDETLDLEELDLDGLKDHGVHALHETHESGDAALALPELPASAFTETPHAHPDPTADLGPAAVDFPDLPDLGELPDFEHLPGDAPEGKATLAFARPQAEEPPSPDRPHSLMDLAMPLAAVAAIPAGAAFLAHHHEAPDSAPPSPPSHEPESPVEPAVAPEGHQVAHRPDPFHDSFPAGHDEPPPIPMPAPAVAATAPATLAPAGAASDAHGLLLILMSDPALMDALAKAVVARLGDQVLREIAWEVMPELAEKLPR